MLFVRDQAPTPQLTEDGFNYKDSSYLFGEIRHLVFSHAITAWKMNFSDVGKTEKAHLQIILNNDEKILISFDEANTWAQIGSGKKKTHDINKLVVLYSYLSQKTFQYRLQRYLKQLTDYGYFVYEDCRFYPHDKIVVRNKDFLLNLNTFLKGQSRVEIHPKVQTIYSMINRYAVITLPPHFKIQIDPDVIFYLLEEYFGLKWT